MRIANPHQRFEFTFCKTGRAGIVSLVGRYSEEASKLLAGLNIYKLGVADASKAVTFSRNQNVWAFDGAKDPYTRSAYYGENYNKVTYLGSSGTIYPTPWQFLPKGGAPQEVKATIPDGYDMAQMKFVTSTGLDITPKAGGGRDLILPLQPASGEELYQVYAFVMNADGTGTYCGAMNVMTRSIKTYKAKLVKLGGTYDLTALRTGLNNIYNPCGIVWELEEDLAFGTDPEYLDALTTILNEGVGPENNDAFFSEYTANQKALNSLYRSYSTGKSTYDDKTVYLFALPSGTQVGDMPIGKQWGYLFNNDQQQITYQTLAHELGHGKLSLAHTFAHNLTKGTTSNLMDYSASTELVARQWGSMHDLAMIDPFQDDADGALRGRNDYEKALLVIEAIRCAYVRPGTTGIQFEKDTKFKFVEPVSTDNFTGLADGVKYEKIKIYLKDDNVTNLPQTVTFVNEGYMSSFDMGNLIVKVNTSQVSQLTRYLQPSKLEYKSQVNDFIDVIKAKYDENNPTSREIIIGILRVSSQCMYEEFIKEQRTALLHRMRNEKSTLALSDEVARIVIDLIRTTPSEDAKYVLDYLSTSGLLEYYDESILDLGTEKKYYTRFIKELLILYNAAYPDRLTNCFTSDQWGNVFVKVTVEKQTFGSLGWIDKNTIPFYQWSKNCKVPTWRYTNNKIDIQNEITCGYYNGAKQYIDPLEPVVVYFEEGLYLDFFEIPTDIDQRVVTVPAFVLSWFRNKAQSARAIDFVSDALTIYASCLSFGQGALISKGVPKVLLAAWSYIYKLDAAMNIILTNDEIYNKIRSIGAGGNNEGRTFLDTYDYISGLIDYVGQPGMEYLVNRNIPDLLSNYISLNKAWDVIESSPLSGLSEQQKIEISSNLLLIKQKLNNGTVIEG